MIEKDGGIGDVAVVDGDEPSANDALAERSIPAQIPAVIHCVFRMTSSPIGGAERVGARFRFVWGRDVRSLGDEPSAVPVTNDRRPRMVPSRARSPSWRLLRGAAS